MENNNDKEEIKDKKEELIEKLEESVSDNRKYWNTIIKDLSEKIRGELNVCLSLQAESISRRQEINEQIATYSYKIFLDNTKLKSLFKSKFEYYTLNYQIKTNSTEKSKIIESDLAWNTAKVMVIENYVDFLMETRKTIDHIVWSVKNKIELYNITGMNG